MCRNVLIYMDTVLQKKLVHVFHYALNPTGYLVLGQAETVGPHAGLFKLVDKKFRVHRKRVSPVYPAVAFPVDYTMPGLPRRKAAAEPATTDNALQGEVSRASLERYAPSGVVVDADMQTVQFRGQTGAFLEPAPGEASLSLLKMAREGLLYGLRTAVHSARKSRQPVRREGLQVRSGTSWRDVTLEVIPLAAGGRPHFLVLFEPADRAKPVSPPPKAKAARRAARRGNVRRRSTSCSASWRRAVSTSSRSSRSSRRPTKSFSPPTKRSCPATKSCRAPTRNWTPPRRSCNRPTKS
jgi:two-component system CheB/CheR fusion protein